MERLPINVRYPSHIRDSLDNIRDLPVITPQGARVRLGDIARIAIEDGPPMIKSENARPAGWVYIDNQYRDAYLAERAKGQAIASEGLREAVSNGALQRLRPIVMTVAAITAGLLPIMIGHGTGSEVMQRIAAPMIGGMVTTLLLTLCVIPALFLVWRRGRLNKS